MRCCVGVPDGAVLEGVEIEVAAELAVDPHEQVLVERRGHAERIVVGEQQLALRLDEIRAEQQQIAGRERARGCARRNSRAAGVSKLPMFDPSSSTSIGPSPSRAAAARRSPTS